MVGGTPKIKIRKRDSYTHPHSRDTSIQESRCQGPNVRPTKINFGASTSTTHQKMPLVWIIQYMDNYKPSKPISPCVLEPSKLLLATNFAKSFLHLAYWSHHHWAANGKQQRTWIWFGFTKFPALQQTHNTQGLVMEVKVTNFSQWYVICERKGEERIKRFVSLD